MDPKNGPKKGPKNEAKNNPNIAWAVVKKMKIQLDPKKGP